MSYADQVFIQNCQDILSKGIWDTDRPVRPRWEDGTPAHTIKLFGVVNRYDLRREFPIITVRKQFLKSAVDELLWIWQKKSNDVHQLSSHIWDAWADENGTIGKAYGYQLGVKHHYPQGDMDQVDKVLWDLKHDPASRRILTNLYNHHDLSEMALYPCAYSMRKYPQWHPEPALPGYAHRQRLERDAVCCAAAHVCPGVWPGGRRAGPRHCRRPHL